MAIVGCRSKAARGSQTLLRHGLVDEPILLVFPVVLGAGKRLFGQGVASTAFELGATRTTSTGVVISTYRRAGRPSFGTIEADRYRQKLGLDASPGGASPMRSR